MKLTVKAVAGVMISAVVAGLLLLFALNRDHGLFGLTGELRAADFIPADGVYKDSPGLEFLGKRKPPVIETKNQKRKVNEACPADFFVIRVTDADGEDLSGRLEAEGEQLDNAGRFLAKAPGVYRVTYTVTDRYGLKARKVHQVLVEW